jgi:membrane protein YdbS with pleckstrin-like domain
MTIVEWVKDAVLRLARVPADPHVPEGAEESVRVFNAGRNYFTWRMILWGLGNAATALGLAAAFAFSYIPTLPSLVRAIWLAVEAGAVGLFVASIPITYFLQRLNYEMRWYIVTDRSLRIRSGVVWLQEITMTFANIQGIRVNANPIERLLGLANVEVRSAGGAIPPHTGNCLRGTWESSRASITRRRFAICLSGGYGCTAIPDWARRRLKQASRFLCRQPVKCFRRRGHCGTRLLMGYVPLSEVNRVRRTSL